MGDRDSRHRIDETGRGGGVRHPQPPARACVAVGRVDRRGLVTSVDHADAVVLEPHQHRVQVAAVQAEGDVDAECAQRPGDQFAAVEELTHFFGLASSLSGTPAHRRAAMMPRRRTMRHFST